MLSRMRTRRRGRRLKVWHPTGGVSKQHESRIAASKIRPLGNPPEPAIERVLSFLQRGKPISVRIPNGATFKIAATLSLAKPFTAINNAKPALLTAAAHGLNDGDVIVIDSAWAKLNGRPARVIDSEAGEFATEGVDITSVKSYPAGSGAGKVRSASGWTLADSTDY